MKIAYLILAHAAPNHAGRLVESLRHSSATVFMHVDAKSDIAPFRPLARLGVRFTPGRIPVYWGDYSQVSVDPNDPNKFWLIGEFAREYNLTQFGHPGGTGGSRWSTWVAGINVAAVPEPASWAMMIAGFGMVGFAMRRSEKVKLSFA